MSDKDNPLTDKLNQIKRQFEKLFSIKGYRLGDTFTSSVWFLKQDKTFQSYITSSTPMTSEPISKRIMDIFVKLNKNDNLKNLKINVKEFIDEITNKIIDAHIEIEKSQKNIQKNKTLEKIAELNELLQMLKHKIESNQQITQYQSTLRANVHSLKNFPKGQYKISLLFNNNFTSEEVKDMNQTERKNMKDSSIDELQNLLEHKKLPLNNILEIQNDNEEIVYRTQKNSLKKERDLKEPNSFPEYIFSPLKKEGCKYILDRRYSGSSLSSFKVELIQNGNKKFESKNEFFFLYELNLLFDELCNINKDIISFDSQLKTIEVDSKNQIGSVDLEITLELDPITRAESLNRVREVLCLTVDTKEDNSNFIKEVLSDYFNDIKESVEAILAYDGPRSEDCCNSCIIY